MSNDRAIGDEIFTQLGGYRFITMTGALNLVSDNRSLSFRIPLSKGINQIRVTLDSSDTYTVEFWNVRGLAITHVRTLSGIYFDMLLDVFTDATGLYTRL